MANNTRYYYKESLTFKESLTGRVVVSAGVITDSSVVVVVVVSVVTSVVVSALSQATNKVEIAKTSNNFFILFNFKIFENNTD